MKDPRAYLDEIRQNLAKLQAQGSVTPAENALFGMVDGLAGLTLITLERVTALEQRLGVPPAKAKRTSPDRPADPNVSAQTNPDIATIRTADGTRP